jgi:putative lipoprotein (rSAM/lipoprotein system)
MKKPVIKLFDKIIVILLGFLGIFNSCSTQVEYGTPYGDYELNGVVIDKETSNPIQNIQIVNEGYRDTIYTDAEGKYVFVYNNYELYNRFPLKIEDIDGEENGGDFATQEMLVTFSKEDQVKPGKGWYEGKFVKTQNIELEKKEAPEYGVIEAVFKP